MRLAHRALLAVLAASLLFGTLSARTQAQSLSNLLSLSSLANLGSLSGLLNLLVGTAPPSLPSFYQPPAPAQNQIWQPGYWASGPAGYFWVPGTWVTPPQTGLLWTPGYWAANQQASQYQWIPGYWAQNVGYYGGVNYGNGYNGSGYTGGRWNQNTFYYNTAITNVNRTIVHYVYSNRGSAPYNGSHVSYNGGRGGINVRPNSTQIAWGHQRHYAMTNAQQEHVRIAAQDRNYLAAVNHGRPQYAGVARPLAANNRPAAFTPLQASDRAHAQATRNMTQRSQPQRAPIRNAVPRAPQRTIHRATQQRSQPQKQQARKSQPQKQPAQRPPQKSRGAAPNSGHKSNPHPHASPHAGNGRVRT